jgi:small subunit ribosomal protein S1
VVTFGAFVEVVPGVEGLVHISELAQHHVENPREVVAQGEVVRAKIIEMDADRRRLSLSLKRVEDNEPVSPPLGTSSLGLSEEVFAEGENEPTAGEEAAAAEPEPGHADAGFEADAAAPEAQGAGDSEGEQPAEPDETAE